MLRTAETPDGIELSRLPAGSVIDLETKSRHYRIEYVGEGKGWISGHPKLCPRPVLAHLQGSIGNSVEVDFIGRGMHLVFQPVDDQHAVTTSAITDMKVDDHSKS